MFICMVGIRLHLSVIPAAPEIHHKTAFSHILSSLLLVTMGKYHIGFVPCQSGPIDLS
jgi:hypothetical protein